MPFQLNSMPNKSVIYDLYKLLKETFTFSLKIANIKIFYNSFS